MKRLLLLILLVWSFPSLALAQDQQTILVTDQGIVTSGPRAGQSIPYQRWLDEARVPTPWVTVEVHSEPCPDYPDESCAAQPVRFGEPYQIYFFPRSSEKRHVFYHELGHIFDYSVMDDQARAKFLSLIGKNPWYDPPNSPHEQFAEAYAFVAAYGRAKPPTHMVIYDYRVSPLRERTTFRLVWRVAARNNAQASSRWPPYQESPSQG